MNTLNICIYDNVVNYDNLYNSDGSHFENWYLKIKKYKTENDAVHLKFWFDIW